MVVLTGAAACIPHRYEWGGDLRSLVQHKAAKFAFAAGHAACRFGHIEYLTLIHEAVERRIRRADGCLGEWIERLCRAVETNRGARIAASQRIVNQNAEQIRVARPLRGNDNAERIVLGRSRQLHGPTRAQMRIIGAAEGVIMPIIITAHIANT